MEAYDHHLLRFEAEGAEALPIADEEGYVEHAGARVWYSLMVSARLLSCCTEVLGTAAIGVIKFQRC